MAWTQLKNAINSAIKANNNQEITGPVLNSVLNSIVNSMGKYATFAGVATPSTNPGVFEGPVVYFANTAGTYSNFDNITVGANKIVAMYNINGTWDSYEIGDNNITTSRIADKAVTSEKLADSAMSAAMTNAVNSVQSNLDEETDNRIAAIEAEEEARVIAISQEAQTRAQNDENLNKAIVAEIDRAKAAEEANADIIAAETARAKAAEEANAAAIEAEAEARDIAINNEAQTRAKNDESLNKAIVAETARAKAAEEANTQAIAKRGIYDVSAYNGGAVFESLSSLLNNANLSTLIPTSVRCGGMTIRFIQGSVPNSDNKYVQYMYTGSYATDATAFVNTDNWEKINLETEVRELNVQVNGTTEEGYEELTLKENRFFNTGNDPLAEWPSVGEGTYCLMVGVTAGDKFIITGLGGNKYAYLYATTNSSRNKVRYAAVNENCRTIPKEITIEEGETYLYVNLTSYNSSTDKVQKIIATHVPGLEDRVTVLEEKEVIEVTDETGSSSTKAASQKLATEIKTEAEEAIAQLDSDIHGTTEDEWSSVTPLIADRQYATQNDPMPEKYVTSSGVYCKVIAVLPGEKFRIYGKGNNKYSLLYVLTNSTRYKTREASLNEDCRTNPKELTIQEGEAYLYVNLTSYDSTTDKLQKAVAVHTHGLEDRVEDLEKEVNNEISVSVPDTIYAVVGDTLQLYYESMFRCVNWREYDVYINCAIGAAYPRYYELTPTNSHVGSHTITIEIRDSQKRVLGTKQCTIIVKAAATSPSSNLNVLCVGASATNDGQWASELKRRLTMSGGTPAGNNFTNITFVGRKDPEYQGITVNLEATGGFSWNNYLSTSTRFHIFYFTQASPAGTVNVGDVYSFNSHNYTVSEINLTEGVGNISCTCAESGNVDVSGSGTLTRVSGTGSETLAFPSSRSLGNPFAYNGVIDLQQYADDYCNGTIDVVCTELFGNGTEAYLDDVSERIQQMQNFITVVRNVFPNCKFFIGMPYVLDPNGGLGINYGATGSWSHRYGMKYTCCNYVTALQKYINDNNMSDYVFIMDWLTEFDSEYDFKTTTKVVNPRSTKTETFGVNGAHPAQAGYYQMADVAYRLFVSKFCQS